MLQLEDHCLRVKCRYFFLYPYFSTRETLSRDLTARKTIELKQISGSLSFELITCCLRLLVVGNKYSMFLFSFYFYMINTVAWIIMGYINFNSTFATIWLLQNICFWKIQSFFFKCILYTVGVRPRAIITCGLYILSPLFEGQNILFQEFFVKFYPYPRSVLKIGL